MSAYSDRPVWNPATRKAMTLERARQVRVWRVEQGMTWRAVATAFVNEYENEKIVAGNQLQGEELCVIAAELLGEDGLAKPWN